MKKKLLAYLCALALLAGVVSPLSAAAEDEAARAADILTLLGLTEGIWAEGQSLEETATRAQAAVLLVRLTAREEEAARDNGASGFQDISGPARAAITYACHQGWANGVSPGFFAPENGISASAWFSFLLRALGYSDRDGDFEVSEAALFARHIGLAQRDYEGTLTRGQLFLSALDALTFPCRDSGETVIRQLAARRPSLRTAANALGLLDTTLTARQAADRLMPAVFTLELFKTEKQIEDNTSSASSSGFFISEDGLAVTNYHSIDGIIHALAVLVTGEVYEVERVVCYDPGVDIAVVRVSRTSVDGRTVPAFKSLELAGARNAHAGDPVYTLGNPLGLGLAVSAGIISATGRRVDSYDLPCVMNTADISQGSSGGALLNVRGQVIAVTTGAYVRGNSMYLGVPVDPVMEADLTAEGWTLAEVAAREADREP